MVAKVMHSSLIFQTFVVISSFAATSTFDKKGFIPSFGCRCLGQDNCLCGNMSPYQTNFLFNSYPDDLQKLAKDLISKLNEIQTTPATADVLISLSLTSVVEMIAIPPGWKKKCHMHPSSASMLLLLGEYSVLTSAKKEPLKMKPGAQVFTPQWNPHAEANEGSSPVVILVKWSPVPDRQNLTIYVDESLCSNTELPDPMIPPLKKLIPQTTRFPGKWTAIALLHPFSPIQNCADNSEDEKANPFFKFAFQLTVASMTWNRNYIVFYLKGCSDGATLWIAQTKSRTFYRTSDTGPWTLIDLNWTLPDSDWLSNKDKTYVGSAPLNWMSSDKVMDWWKVKDSNNSIWFWYERNERTRRSKPFRLMYSLPPTNSTNGSKDKLALFQMFSFSYIVFGEQYVSYQRLPQYLDRSMIDYGLTCQNPDKWPLFEWPTSVVVSSLDIPIDAPSNPIPTKVTYQWKKDLTTKTTRFDRFQISRFTFNAYNKDNEIFYEEAILFGPNCEQRGKGFIINDNKPTWESTCIPLPLGQQPPNWAELGSGKIHAVIRKPPGAPESWVSPFTGSSHSVALIGALFPPALPKYPDSTYLWTWYDYSLYGDKPSQPFTKARPITFMQSAPGPAVGTNLALADYFDFYEISPDIKLSTQYTTDKLDKACGTKWSEPSKDLTDEERAIEKVPRDDYKGTTFTDMALVLNNWLSAANPTKPCNNWTVQELQNFQEIVFGHRDVNFEFIYSKTEDNRQMGICNTDDLKETWTNTNELAKSCNLEAILRDGHCHEAVMWYTHHLTQDKKAMLHSSGTVIPLLSLVEHEPDDSVTPACQEIYAVVKQQVTCASCHKTSKTKTCPSQVEPLIKQLSLG